MEPLNFPVYQAQIKTTDGKTLIFDLIRKKYVTLTPEEWVRQHLIHYLTTEKKCPSSLISVETSLRFARLNKRSDLIVNDRNGQALLLAECKAPEVAISTKTFEQIAIYNQTVKAPFLLLTNGMQHYCMAAATAAKPAEFLTEIPNYAKLNGEMGEFTRV
ncbi:MAG: type I restriction enzyme HsdR N-terminal domain-containing protein [Bacteroidales bacterium]|jgi:hypothetical protein|nr:type I restriction enzyme HsdR N-terminal domain-containing protein [Bacteroidales bacterium]